MFFLCLFAILSTATRTVLNNRRVDDIPSDWEVSTVEVKEEKTISFILALKQRNLDRLESLFWQVSDPTHANYRQFMTIDEIDQLVAPPQHLQHKVAHWLRKAGVQHVEMRGDAIYAKAPLNIVGDLFRTEFMTFRHIKTGNLLVRQVGEMSIPSRLAKVVDFVAGLTEFPTQKYTLKRSPEASAPETMVSISPQSIQTIYKTGSAKVTQNSSACVIEFEGQNYSPKDLSDFATSFDVKIPALTSNHIVGNNNGNEPQIEATLDIEYALAVAIDAEGWFWLEDYGVWLYGFANHIYSTPTAPLVNSISYGWDEEAQCQNGIGGSECRRLGVDNAKYVQRVNVEFQKVGIRGITLICASGDSGANGRTDGFCSEDHLNPVFPAASPYITSVGATQISAASGRANLPNPPSGCSGRACASAGTEECVSFSQAHFASGGGFSDIAPTPTYQKAAVAAYLNSGVALPPTSYFNVKGRGFPDVSAFGSQVLIMTRGSIEPVGGTSAASPIFAGVVALLNDHVVSKTGKPLGFVSPLLYKMAAEHPATFTDVTVGDNICTESGCHSSCKGFKAAKGWDPVSGLGTPVYPEMLQYVKQHVTKESK